MEYSRREFGRLALAGLPAALSLESLPLFAAAKPDSKWAGVQVGMNVPYNFGTGNYTTGDEIIDRCVKLGISGVELRAQPVELFLGSPAAIAGAAQQGQGRRGGGGGGAARGGEAPAAAAAGAGAQPTVAAGEAQRGGGAAAAGEARRGGGGGGGGRAALTPEQEAAQKAAADETRKWRS